MRLDHLFVIAPVIATVQARCYGMTVDMYGQMMIGADAVVDESCTHDLAGYFTEGQTKYHCLQLTSNKVTSLTVLRKTPRDRKYKGYFNFEQTQLYRHIALFVHRSPQCTESTFKYLGLSRTNKLHSHCRRRSSSVEGLLLKHYGDCALQRLR
jgi:hypothetical protein